MVLPPHAGILRHGEAVNVHPVVAHDVDLGAQRQDAPVYRHHATRTVVPEAVRVPTLPPVV